MLRRNRILFSAVTAVAVAGLAIGCGSNNNNATGGGGSTGGGATAQGSFVQVGSLATGRKGHTATLIPSTGQVLIAGGLARSGNQDVAVDTAELFDPGSGRFIPVQSRLSGGRAYHAAAVSAIGNVILAGGQSDAQAQNVLSSVEVFNAQTGRFSTATALNQRLTQAVGFTYPAQGAERYAIVGGRTSAGSASNAGFRYSADAAPRMLGQINLAQARYNARVAPLDDTSSQVLIQGGLTTTLEVFDAATETVRAVGQLSRVRFAACVARLGNTSRVAIIGGRANQATTSAAENTIEIYDASTGLVQTAAATLTTARSDAACVTLPNGDVLVIGGISATGQVLNSTEIISGNGTDVTVRPGPVMKFARSGHTATLLKNGTVLVAGGQDQNGTPIAEAEVFALRGTTVPKPTVLPGAQAPQITAINPTQGPIGTRVTITATNIGTNVNEIVVKFGNLLAPAQSAVQNSSGAVDVAVVVPSGAVTGPVTITNVAGQVSNSVQFTVTTGGNGNNGGGNGSFGGAQPRIWLVLPSRASSFIPVGIGGANFDNPSTPYFTPVGSSNSVASVSLFNWGIRNIPLIGSVSIGFTITPPALPSGPATLEIEYYGMRSNPFPFTKN